MSKRLFLPVSTAMVFFLGFEAGGFQLSLLKVTQDYAVKDKWMGTLVAVQYVASILFPLLLGGLSDRIGKKKVLLLFAIMFTAGCAMISSIPHLTGFIIGIFILGAGFSMSNATISAAVADRYLDRQGKYQNIVQSFFCLGAVAGPVVSDLAIDAFGLNWRVVFMISGSAYAVLFVMLFFTEFGKRHAVNTASIQQNEEKHSYKMLLHPIFCVLLIAITIYVALECGLGFYFDYLFVQKLNSPELSASAISLFWLAMMFSRLIGSMVHRYEKTILLVLFLCIAALAFSVASITNPILSLICCLVLGFAHGPIWPGIVSLAAQEYPSETGMVTGVLFAGCGVGGALSPIMIGYFAGSLGIQISFIILAFVAVAGFISILCYRILKHVSSLKHRLSERRVFSSGDEEEVSEPEGL